MKKSIITERKPKRKCDACKSSDKKEGTAKFHCVECNINICLKCTQKHQLKEVLSGHKVIGLSSGDSAQLTCKIHDHKTVTFFCQTCHQTLCPLCVATDDDEHLGHNITGLTEGLEDKIDAIKLLLEGARKKHSELRQLEVKVAFLNNACEKSFVKAERTVREHAAAILEKVTSQVKEQEAELLEELTVRHKAFKKQAEIDTEIVTFQLENLQKLCYNAEKVVKSNNSLTVLATYRSILDKLTMINEEELPFITQMGKVVSFKHKSSERESELDLGYLEESSVDTLDDMTNVAKFKSQEHPGGATAAPVDDDKEEEEDAYTKRRIDKELARMKARVEDGTESSLYLELQEAASRDKLPSPPRSFQSEADLSSASRVAPRLLLQIGKRGTELGDFCWPTDGAFLPNGNFVISDYWNQRLQLFDPRGKLVHCIGQRKVEAYALAITPDGNIAVTHDRGDVVKIFTPEGKLRKQFKDHSTECGIAVTKDGLLVVGDSKKHSISIHKPDGTVVHKFGKKGSAPEELLNPHYVAVNSHGEIITSDYGNHCIKVFTSNGDFLHQIGSRGMGDGQLHWPAGVCVDKEDNIIVADYGTNRVCMFDREGTFMGCLLGPEAVLTPHGLALNEHNQLLVTEMHRGIKVFQLL